MLETCVLCLFALGLVICLILNAPILYALAFGYAVFFFYGVRRGHSAKAVFLMSLKGVASVKSMLITFLCIGMLTATWRACGAIAYIIDSAASLIPAQAFLLAEFLLCCLISFLTGTAFGTSATAGVICMTMANALGIPPLLSGGAILSGCYFGDRCSPMSTSALLVSQLTGTDIYRNIRNMVRTSVFPFAIACGLYLALGFGRASGEAAEGVLALFHEGYRMHWAASIPAVLIVVLALLRLPVRKAMLVSIAAACVLCLTLQGVSFAELARLLFFGYRAADPRIGAMMNGGGVFSMLSVAATVCISSSYAGIFDGTGLLLGLKQGIERLARRVSPFGATLVTAVLTCMASCNQTLASILTHQLCRNLEPDRERMAIYIENSSILIAPLIPWSIACVTAVTTVGAPLASAALAFYLYLVPVWNLVFPKAAQSISGQR